MLELHQRILNRVYSEFRDTGKWPSARKLEMEFADEGEIDDIADELGHEYLTCQDPARVDAECYLGIRGIAACEEAKEDLDNFLAAIPLFAETYIEGTDDGGKKEILSSEIAEKLHIDELAMRRLTAIIRVEGPFVSGGSYSNDGSASFTPNRAAFRLRKVSNLEEYLESKMPAQRLRNSRITSGSVPVPLQTIPTSIRSPRTIEVGINVELIRDPRFREILRKDLEELEICRTYGAWKAVGLLAGSCCEAILLDLLSRKTEYIPERDQSDWQRKYGLKDLARAASAAGLLEPLEKTLAEQLKEWRDLVHPIRQSDSPRPTKNTANALIAVLSLVGDSLERAAI